MITNDDLNDWVSNIQCLYGDCSGRVTSLLMLSYDLVNKKYGCNQGPLKSLILDNASLDSLLRAYSLSGGLFGGLSDFLKLLPGFYSSTPNEIRLETRLQHAYIYDCLVKSMPERHENLLKIEKIKSVLKNDQDFMGSMLAVNLKLFDLALEFSQLKAEFGAEITARMIVDEISFERLESEFKGDGHPVILEYCHCLPGFDSGYKSEARRLHGYVMVEFMRFLEGILKVS